MNIYMHMCVYRNSGEAQMGEIKEFSEVHRLIMGKSRIVIQIF